LLLALFVSASVLASEQPVATFPPPIDSTAWTALLQKYVDANGLVGYARWKAEASDRRKLETYLANFGKPGGAPSDDQKAAILINAYNGFMIETILDHYPVDGIRSIPGGFTVENHAIGGKKYSLDEIEHTAVRLAGFRAHSAMVCASRSCPPLDRRAYDAKDLSAREDERMRVWMGREDLYQFDPAKNLVRIPKYFDWYRADFENAGVPKILSDYAPARFREWLSRGSFKIEYLEYDWSLNDRDRPR
jgi:hypothetical protein